MDIPHRGEPPGGPEGAGSFTPKGPESPRDVEARRLETDHNNLRRFHESLETTVRDRLGLAPGDSIPEPQATMLSGNYDTATWQEVQRHLGTSDPQAMRAGFPFPGLEPGADRPPSMMVLDDRHGHSGRFEAMAATSIPNARVDVVAPPTDTEVPQDLHTITERRHDAVTLNEVREKVRQGGGYSMYLWGSGPREELRETHPLGWRVENIAELLREPSKDRPRGDVLIIPGDREDNVAYAKAAEEELDPQHFMVREAPSIAANVHAAAPTPESPTHTTYFISRVVPPDPPPDISEYEPREFQPTPPNQRVAMGELEKAGVDMPPPLWRP